MITSVKISGFKSFGYDAAPITLGPLNFVVGANASGKTNFVSALRFLKEAVLRGLDSAVGNLGEPSDVFSKCKGGELSVSPLAISIRLGDADSLGGISYRQGEEYSIKDLAYDLHVARVTTLGQPVVKSESLQAQMSGPRGERDAYELRRDEKEIIINDPVEERETKTKNPSAHVAERDATKLVVGSSFLSTPCSIFRDCLEHWHLFDIKPDVARQPARLSLTTRFGEGGGNLAAILQQIGGLDGNGTMRAILSGLRGAVPDVEGVKPIPFGQEGHWSFELIENHIKGSLSSRSVSDGTVRLLALLIIANWITRWASLVVIEEPENGLHPHLSEQIVDLLRHASGNCQIIVTTHNPAFLDHLKPEEIILCDKRDGQTVMRHASDVEDVSIFQKHFSLGELWVQGALGGIP